MSSPFNFGGLSAAGSGDDTIAFSRHGEAISLDVLLTADHLTEMADALTTLLFMGDHTERARVGSYLIWGTLHSFVRPVWFGAAEPATGDESYLVKAVWSG